MNRILKAFGVTKAFGPRRGRVLRVAAVVALLACAPLWAAEPPGAKPAKANPAEKKAEQPVDDARKVDPAAAAFFENKVRPIFVERCLDCHSGDEPESGLSLESRESILRGGALGPAIVPGDPKQSLLVRVIGHSEILKMPAKQKLPAAEIAVLTQWIKIGAPWPGAKPTLPAAPEGHGATLTYPTYTKEQRSFWAFQPPADPPLPEVEDAAWGESPLDRFVLARLEAAGLRPAPRADRRTLIRRATFDLTGLPPTPEEVEAFVEDRSPDAYARLIDRLLASPRYGERWGRHWLDVARYADSNGLDENLAYVGAYLYRDYVIGAFNSGKPFDRFVREQIAGDLLDAGDDPLARSERDVATGFLALGAKMLAEDDPVKMQMDIVDEQVSTIGSTFMGLTIGCARCHDHKFDPISAADYYALAGILKSTKTMENFSVVAKWYERPVETSDYHRSRALHDEQVAALAAKIKADSDRLSLQLAQTLRSGAAKYLLAGTELVLHPPPEAVADGKRPLGPTVTRQAGEVLLGTERLAPRGVLLEAEEYHRGNVVRDRNQYGKGIGVVYNAGAMPNFIEFDFELPVPGRYQLELRYAAATRRPLDIAVNGETVKSNAAGEVTGGWFPEHQRWSVEGVFEFKAGKNTVRLGPPSGPICHIDKILIVASPPSPVEADGDAARTPRQLAAHYSIDENLLKQMRDVLARDKKSDAPDPLVALWWAYAALPENDFSRRAAEVTRRLDASEPPAAQDPAAQDPAAGVPAVVKTELRSAPPESLAAVAEILGRIVSRVDQAWALAEQNDASRTTLPDGELEAVRRLIHGPKSSFGRAAQQAVATDASPLGKEIRDSGAALAKLKTSAPPPPTAMGVTEGATGNTRIHLRGSHLTLGPEVPRVFPQILVSTEQTPVDKAQSGRLQLATWLSAPDHPLTGRVMVNRLWRWHFGTGLVRSPDNFGTLGQRPTHPLLLDWLTLRFVEEGWSMKKMHRRIMLSSTYQMSSRYEEASDRADPENRLLWRREQRRLDAESMRDAVIALGTGLDLSMGGSLLKNKPREYVTSTANRDDTDYDTLRRSVYLPVVRSSLYDVFQAFDFADPSTPNGDRATTTIAPQALFMMNSQIVSRQSGAMAERLLARTDLDDAGRVREAFLCAFSRTANEKETARALEGLNRIADSLAEKNLTAEETRRAAWQSLCRVLIASSNFVYVQ